MGRKIDRTDLGATEEGAKEMRERLRELGYADGGHLYEFDSRRTDLSEAAEEIEEETGLKFVDGEDGHMTSPPLRITSKRELTNDQLRKIEEVI